MKFIKTKDVKSPERAHLEDSGIDFFIPNWWQRVLLPKRRAVIQLWIKTILPKWCDLQFVDKSGLASKFWITILWWLIDNWYIWELAVVVYNTWEDPYLLRGGDKIVQGVIRNINCSFPEEIDEDEFFAETDFPKGKQGIMDRGMYGVQRWEGWFGSTWLE